MKASMAWLISVLVIVGGAGPVPAADLKDRVKIEVLNVGLHSGMDPGLYVCGQNHLHIKGTVQNLSDVAVGRIKVGGKALDGQGNLLGTATFVTKQARLGPGEKAEINVEFLTVTGPMIQQVKNYALAVLEVAAAP